ncbi:MAG: hypothetical protein ACTIM4_12915 [Marinomonas sp.]
MDLSLLILIVLTTLFMMILVYQVVTQLHDKYFHQAHGHSKQHHSPK